MAVAKFLNGTKEQLDEKKLEDGCIYFITDTKEIYVDIPQGNRILFSPDTDMLYDLMKDRLLSDPSAVFQGATETSDGAAGLVPKPEL